MEGAVANFDNISVGDKVLVHTRRFAYPRTVTRVTRTQFTAGGVNYRRSNGYEVGGDEWHKAVCESWDDSIHAAVVARSRRQARDRRLIAAAAAARTRLERTDAGRLKFADWMVAEGFVRADEVAAIDAGVAAIFDDNTGA